MANLGNYVMACIKQIAYPINCAIGCVRYFPHIYTPADFTNKGFMDFVNGASSEVEFKDDTPTMRRARESRLTHN